MAYFFADMFCDSASKVCNRVYPRMLYPVLYLIKFEIKLSKDLFSVSYFLMEGEPLKLVSYS